MGTGVVTGNGSGAARRALGRMLYDLRIRAGVKATDLARNKIVSRDKLWRIEKGQSPVRAGDVAALCWAYRADEATVERLTDFSYKTLEPTIYEKYRDVMPSWFGMYVELESFASGISSYQPELVLGLLQTPDFARALFERHRPRLTEDVVKQRVATRLERARRVLEGPGRPRINVVFSEAVMARQVGGPEVMRRQVQWLRELGSGNQVSVRIVTWESGAHAAMDGAFTLMEFEDDSEPAVAYQENRAGAAYIEPPEEVADYWEMFNAVTAQAIPIEEYL
jgi:transcriptional regulator with XRE-family HTH domain